MQALIKAFQGTEITMRQVSGRWAMTAEQFGVALGAAEPRKYTQKLIERNRDELEGFLSVVKLTTEAGPRDATAILDQGILILAMLAKTDRAKAFRRWVADLLMELKDGSKQVVEAEVLEALLHEVRSLKAAAEKPDPKTLIAQAVAANITGFCPSVQKIIVTTALALPPEAQSVWTATQIAAELGQLGIVASARKVGMAAKAAGIQCPKEEGECGWGYWATTSVNNFAKVVPQYQYTKPGRDRLLGLFAGSVTA